MSGLDSMVEYDEIVRKRFCNEEEGFEFYNSYAKEKGFSVRRSYCEWDSGHTEMTLRKFVCSREGFREEKELKRENRKRKPRNITRVGCRAKLVIAREKNTGQWHVRDFFQGHNHLMVDQDLACLLRSHRGISDAQKADILEMRLSGIRQHQIMDIMRKQYGGYDKVGYTIRDLYNFCHSNKVKTIAEGDAQTVISYLTENKNKDPDNFFEYTTDGEGHLKALIWCDCQSRFDYEAFGDVVIFDSTYKTNRYNLPLVPFVGLNHHNCTVLFACGVIAQETIESYVWLLRTFTDAMAQKYPVSVITDGDIAMQRAIGLVWPNSTHRLCTWHIELNIPRNVHDDIVKDEFRCFLYDCCSIEEIERKWLEFLKKYKVIDHDSWLYQMYERRKMWCAAYHIGKCYLQLRSNQRSESMNSRLKVHLDRKMTMLQVVQHFDQCLESLRNKELEMDCEASKSEPCVEPDASNIEKKAAKAFTPQVFAKVQFSIRSANKCFIIEEIDEYDICTYIVGKVGKGDKQYFVKFELCIDEGNIEGISCSCLRLQSCGTPCSHIFFVLEYREKRELPECCVWKRWTMGAKRAFPAIRKSTMYDYSESLERYRELRNISHNACFIASQSTEAYERVKRVLNEEAAMMPPDGGENRGNKFGPVLPQAEDVDFAVSDPLHVPGRGAPKKKLKLFSNKNKSRVKCTLCKEFGHNRRTCSMRKEEALLPEDVSDA